ncbi:uncharacterized protein LOC109010211 isoform X2 [Juglans regia]|uniref:Uncharacterized protein LOC109010211 isoform X2 n=1 Tax=Juglans regia TaxID=51240 RepID=A0A6P9E9R2_JUGRE|nr:uncharacterized protein LOC109010211 isoform X2 [Juglans regia]
MSLPAHHFSHKTEPTDVKVGIGGFSNKYGCCNGALLCNFLYSGKIWKRYPISRQSKWMAFRRKHDFISRGERFAESGEPDSGISVEILFLIRKRAPKSESLGGCLCTIWSAFPISDFYQ